MFSFLANINVTTDGSADLKRNEKDGHLYMHFTSVNVDPTIGNMVFLADGLMPEPLLSRVYCFFFIFSGVNNTFFVLPSR